MKVYRCVDENELKNLLNNPENLGGYFDNENNANTFHYERDKKYIHFFKHKKDVRLIKPFIINNKKLYVCTFDIPFRKLIFHSGKGYYYEKSDYDLVIAREFALPKEDFKQDYLVEVEQENS